MLGRTIERLKILAARLAPEFSWTNYTKQDKKGDLPVHGAARLTWQDGRTSFRLEWNFLSRFAHVGAEVDPMESEAKVFAAVPPVALWLMLDSWPLLHGLLRRTRERELSLRIHDGSIWWKIWADPNNWSSQTPRWRDGNFSVVDAILGEQKTTTEVIDRRNVEIPMPEGCYRGISTLERVTVERPRWFADRFVSATVSMDPRDDERLSPIPLPGKGENAWDCDEDALYRSSVRVSTHAEAIGKVVAGVLRSRHQRGGFDWRPEGGPFGSKAGGGGRGGADDDPLAASTMPPDAEPLATATSGALDAWARFYGTERQAGENCEQLRARLMNPFLSLEEKDRVQDLLVRMAKPAPSFLN